MMIRERRQRPQPWVEQKSNLKHAWLLPFLAIEWSWAWIAFLLSNWAFLEAIEYLGSFSVLVAVILFFHESGDRVKQRHYQAWQVINTAQGKGGSGGRIEALQELNADRVPLVGVDVSGAFLQGVRLPRAHLLRSDFTAADVRNSDLQSADFTNANLRFANFRESNLRNTSFQGAGLDDADLWGADLSGADFSEASLVRADLRHANLSSIHWQHIRSLSKADIDGVKNAPEGFVAWALQKGAIQGSDPR